MAKTYDIKSELFEIQKLIESDTFDVNEETGEVVDNSEILQQLLSEITLDQSEKADNIIYLIKEEQASEKAMQEEIKRLTERKAMFKRKQESLKQLLDFLLGGQKLKTDRFTIFYRNTNSVEILDETMIPAEYINVTEVFKIDKKRIKDALGDFTEVDGAEMKTTTSLQFK